MVNLARALARRWSMPTSLFLALACPAARADHLPAPIAVGEGTPIAGGVAVLEGGGALRLDGATVRVSLEAEGYRFAATYGVVNPGPSVRVRVGVPLAGITRRIHCGEGESPPDCDFDAHHPELAQLPAHIDLRLGGVSLPCRLMIPPGPRWTSEEPSATLPWKAVGWLREPEGWCIAEATVAARSRVALALGYRGTYRFEDRWNRADGTTSRPVRSLRIDPFPGSWVTEGYGGWTAIEVDTGRFAGLAEIAGPRQVSWKGSVASIWPAPAGDPLAQEGWDGTLAITLDVEPVLRTEELLSCNGVVGQWTVRASSTLPPQSGRSYVARSVIDMDPATAWCEGADGPGPGSWLELEYRPGLLRPSPQTSFFAGYVLVPGYARSQEAWIRNRRLRAVRLSRCDPRDAGVVVRFDGTSGLSLADRYDRAAIVLPPIPDDPVGAAVNGDADAACVRLTVLEVAEGKDADACVSEFRPILRCRPEPPLGD